jgi:acyl-CoA synthetase (AMP-forming)/AMP-acid ligase II
MINPTSTTTLNDAFSQAANRYAERPFLMVPAAVDRDYDALGRTLSYAQTADDIAILQDAYRNAGYGHGHRVALLLDNRLEHVLHRLAMNGLGVSCVPINPEYRSAEIAYLLEHSEAALVVALASREAQIMAGIAAASVTPAVTFIDAEAAFYPARARSRAPLDGPVSASSESSLLYTSGTTGRPKGCMLSHRYELESGHWYATRGGLMALHEGRDRIYNPLPLYHVNAGTVSLFGAMLTGNCQIQPDRFHPSHWWRDLSETGATIMHYLGIVAPMLLNQPESSWERQHRVRLGLGAGIEPDLHAQFEERFGFPLVELWGMTEMVRILAAGRSVFRIPEGPGRDGGGFVTPNGAEDPEIGTQCASHAKR